MNRPTLSQRIAARQRQERRAKLIDWCIGFTILSCTLAGAAMLWTYIALNVLS